MNVEEEEVNVKEKEGGNVGIKEKNEQKTGGADFSSIKYRGLSYC